MGVVSSVGVVDDDELAKESEDVKENVKRKFLVQMPEDFYQFWDFCKSLNPSNPQGLCVAIRLGRVAQLPLLSVYFIPGESCPAGLH